jgi:hypothetical protein
MSIHLEVYMKKNAVLGEHIEEYRQLQKQLRNVQLLAQGNVFATEPHPKAPRASTNYKWTRKVKGKTVSVTLSKEQFEAFKEAIEANRMVENALKRMRQIAQDSILSTLPDSPRKQARNTS